MLQDNNKLARQLRLRARIINISAVIFLLLLGAGAARAACYKFIGGAQTNPNAWNNEANWRICGTNQSGQVPTPSDDAVVDAPNTNPIVNGIITVTNLTVSNGGIIESGNITVTNKLIMSGGSFKFSTVAVQTTLEISGGATLNGAVLSSAGTATLLTNALSLTSNGNTTAEFRNSGTFTLRHGTSIARPNPSDASIFYNFSRVKVADPNVLSPTATIGSSDRVSPFFENHGTVETEVSGGLNLSTSVSNYGELKAASGDISAGTITVQQNGSLNLYTGSSLTGGGFTEVAGIADLQSDVTANRFRLLSGGTFSADSGNTMTILDKCELKGGLIREARITVNAGKSLDISGDNTFGFGANLLNNGTINVSSGSIVRGSPAFGNMGATITNNGGTMNITTAQFPAINNSAWKITNVGIINITGTQTTIGWDFSNIGNGSVTVQQGTLTFNTGTVQSSRPITANSGAVVEFNKNAIFFSTATLQGAGTFKATGDGTISINDEVLAVRFEYNGSNKTITGPGNLVITNLFDWVNGVMQGLDKITVEPGATLKIDGNSQSLRLDDCTIDNFGLMIQPPGTVLTADNGASIINEQNANFTIQSGAILHATGADTTLTNFGTVSNEFTGSTGLNLNLTNYNVLNLGISQTTVKNFTQTTTGTTNSDIASASSYGRLTATQTAALGGTDNINCTGGYVPTAPTPFQPFTYGTRTGTFSGIGGLDIGNQRILLPVYNSNNLTLNTTAVSPTVAPPVLTSVRVIGTVSKIQGTYHGLPNTTYSIYFWDERGVCSGAAYITTNVSGDAIFNVSIPVDLYGIKAIATLGDNTSVYSNFVPAIDIDYDFDGDGNADVSNYKPNGTNFDSDNLTSPASNSEWWYKRSSDEQVRAAQFGTNTDKIVPGDYTGDGKTDIAFWRPSTGEWFILRSEDGSFFSFPFGQTDDIPAPADYDGDGKTDAAVFRPSTSTWYIFRSRDGGVTIIQFGASGDKPVAADYDGDGKSDIAIWRASVGEWWYRRSSDGQVRAVQFGTSSDKAVPADYTGDGKADVAFWRPSTGEWFILRSENASYFSFPFGQTGDIPAPADYDGDGKTDATVFRPSSSTWFINRTSAGVLILTFGSAGDIPIPSAYVP